MYDSHAPALKQPEALLDRAIAEAAEALIATQRADGHFVFELEADATIPAEYVLLQPLSGRAGRTWSWSARSASICAASRASTAAGRCSTTAPSTSQRQRQGLFRAEDDRRRSRRAAHGPGARGDPGARRGGGDQCLHPHPAGALRRRSRGTTIPTMPVGADPAAALVPDPSVEDELLGAHGDRAAAGAAGEEAAGAQPARRARRGAVRPDASAVKPKSKAANTKRAWALVFDALDVVLKAVDPFWPEGLRAAGHRRAASPSSPSG